MKNPFERKDHTVLIAVVAAGALTAAFAAYLYLTESGAETRRELRRKIKGEIKDAVAGAVSKKTKISKKAVKKAADLVAK